MLPELTPTEIDRYRRQIMLPGLGDTGQRQLKNTTALVTGVGGLGGTAALYPCRGRGGKIDSGAGGRPATGRSQPSDPDDG